MAFVHALGIRIILLVRRLYGLARTHKVFRSNVLKHLELHWGFGPTNLVQCEARRGETDALVVVAGEDRSSAGEDVRLVVEELHSSACVEALASTACVDMHVCFVHTRMCEGERNSSFGCLCRCAGGHDGCDDAVDQVFIRLITDLNLIEDGTRGAARMSCVSCCTAG